MTSWFWSAAARRGFGRAGSTAHVFSEAGVSKTDALSKRGVEPRQSKSAAHGGAEASTETLQIRRAFRPGVAGIWHYC